ncbi:hypothetical protein ASwh1_271 [Aeromonas phage Aswh_1]|nr:hypothetical protein ASwh1_271 [Aeromonas phage Aswh_1]
MKIVRKNGDEIIFHTQVSKFYGVIKEGVLYVGTSPTTKPSVESSVFIINMDDVAYFHERNENQFDYYFAPNK